eukprot:SRR837773.11529.p2 GENE.SRR837773.11529~~SRR837773.11529.p2  ORF type:complete len:149 (+),score=52.02 SRR837773.11529:37-483(+)
MLATGIRQLSARLAPVGVAAVRRGAHGACLGRPLAAGLRIDLRTEARFFSGTGVSEIEARRKRLLWRAKCRGWLELDVLMGTFAEKNLPAFDNAKLDLFEEVLELENPDLFKWFTGQAKVPDELKENEVMALLVEYVKSDHGSGLNDK